MTEREQAREAWALWLRARMEVAGVSVGDAARACRVGRSTVQHWRGGKIPPTNVARSLARVLGVKDGVLLRAAEGLL